MADLFAYDGTNTLAFIIAAFVVGIILACFGMLYEIKLPGRVIRTLLKKGALSPDSAVGADSFGITNEVLLRFMFKETGALAKYVRVDPTETVKVRGKERSVYRTATFYLIPETKNRAAIRYERKRASVPALIAAIILFSVLGVILLTVIPDLVQMTKNLIKIITEA